MSYAEFTLALKSTLDYEAKQLADQLGLPFVDLNSESFNIEELEGDQPFVCWEFASVNEDPRDPLYLVMFDIGVATFMDPSQYISLDLLGAFNDHFRTGRIIQVYNYSGADMPDTVAGTMFVTASGVTPQQADRAIGLRFITVTARANRHG